jgi:hypothetical protein
LNRAGEDFAGTRAELALQHDQRDGDNLPERRPVRGLDTLEIFMNQAGMALEKALLEKRIAELQKEQR